jgi:hypothetical protein
LWSFLYVLDLHHRTPPSGKIVTAQDPSFHATTWLCQFPTLRALVDT